MADQITGADLRRARESKGWGLEKLAGKIGVTKSHLSKVERGIDGRQVTNQLIQAYKDALRLPGIPSPQDTSSNPDRLDGRNAAFTPGVEEDWPEPHAPASTPTGARHAAPTDLAEGLEGTQASGYVSPPVADTVEAMRRRAFIGAMAALGASHMGVPTPAPQAGRVGAGDVARLRAATDRLYALDYQHGGEGLWQTGMLGADDGYAMLESGSYNDRTGQQLMRATGRMQICTGWLASDAGKHDVARHCYNEALLLARQAGDPEIETHALANLAFLSSRLEKPREAWRLAVAAERTATMSGCPPRLAVIPHLRRSVAAATDGDETASGRAIRDARMLLDRQEDEAPNEEATSFVTQAEVDGIEGTCAIWLHEPKRAAALLERAINGHDDRFARTRALYEVRLAQARIDAGAVDGAAEAIDAAMDDLAGEVASWRVTTELDAVLARLAKHSRVQGVDLVLARANTLRAARRP